MAAILKIYKTYEAENGSSEFLSNRNLDQDTKIKFLFHLLLELELFLQIRHYQYFGGSDNITPPPTAYKYCRHQWI